MSEEEVKDVVAAVEAERQENVRLKMAKVLKDKHLVAYVRELHDREARIAHCPQCSRAGFDDWLHFSAHLRTHVLDEMLRGEVGAKEAGVALQALRDTDKIMIPTERHEAEVEIPGGRESLLATLGPALSRRVRILDGNHTYSSSSPTPPTADAQQSRSLPEGTPGEDSPHTD